MLRLENVSKKYDGVTILDNINLEIQDGEIVSILGPSGCGKTTLLNLILGITEADSGKIIYQGEDITDVPMEKRGFNIVFQDYALFPNLNVYKNVVYGLRNKPGISSPQEVEDLIDLLGLREHLSKRIDQLSGGQKQREMEIRIGSTTGYTDAMMEIVAPKAKEQGYEPDAWFSPNAVNNMGRPYPYMIFENMKALQVRSVDKVVKVGDTLSDIREGKNAGVFTVGVIEGSSELGLTREEYEALTGPEREAALQKVTERYLAAGADRVIRNMAELLEI